jgi:Fe-S oxidoreductase
MDVRDAVTGVFWLAVAAFAVGLWQRARLWRRGRPAAVDWRGLLAVPRRYVVDLHDVVAREPFVARAHVAVGGGAVLCLVLVALNDGLGLRWRALDGLLVLAALGMLGGALAMAWRRRAGWSRLSQGPWQRLPYTLALGAVALAGLGAVAWFGAALAPLVAGALVLGLAVVAAEFALGIGLAGPMKHAVAGLLHLGLHPRPSRFGPQPVGPGTVRTASALQPLALDQGERGQAQATDFAWNRLLAFDACVQCGRCEAACPAYAAGQPLNPKRLVQDLVIEFSGADPATYRGSPHPGRPGPFGDDTLWSCTTCRACVQACPMMIEHVDAVIGLRRQRTLVGGEVPGKGQALLDALRETDTQGRFALAARYHWASDLDLPVLAPGGQAEWLLLAGESAFELRSQRTLRLLVRTLAQTGIRPTVLGGDETDCGDVARRLGDEAGFQRLARALIAALACRTVRRIVTADPHVLHCLRNEYPLLDAAFAQRGIEVWHHTELLADLLAQGRLQPQHRPHGDGPVTLHDPCYLGRYNGQTAAPRAVLKGIGIQVVEMDRHGTQARCCGGGGGAPYTDVPGRVRIPDLRMDDARATGAATVAVACPQCTAMLEGVVGPRPEVRDVVELVAESLGVRA